MRSFSLSARPVLAAVAPCAFAATACTPGSPAARPTSQPPTPRPTLAPTRVVAAPTVQLVEGNHVASPSAAVHVFLWGNPETTDRDLQLAKDAGFTWVKQRFEWRYIEKSRKSSFEWDEPDRVVDAINRAGLGIIARIDNQPEWARKDGTFPASGPPDQMEDWKDYVEELAERYRGKIQAYEIWNEPNLAREWGSTQPDPVAYTDMLRVSYTAIKKADPNAMVISAGLSPTTEQTDRATPDSVYLRAMYQAGAAQYFDALGVHAPGFKATPEADPADVARDPALTNGDSSFVDLRRAYSFRHAEDMRQIMVDNGDQAKQVAIMEMGWTSDPRSTSPYAWHAVTEDQKADYLARAFRLAQQRWSPWVGIMSTIYLPDPSWTPEQEQYHWSITSPDGSIWPAYNALKSLLPSLNRVEPGARPAATPTE
jgi:sugar phosphate isomerase/epimerase